MLNRLFAVKTYITSSIVSARMGIRDRLYDCQVKFSKRERARFERTRARISIDW
jgi:hypothetical protein